MKVTPNTQLFMETDAPKMTDDKSGVLRQRISLLQYFEAVEDNEEAGSRDPLLDMAQLYPDEVLRFLKRSMFLAILTAITINVPCFIFLLVNWTASGSCDKPLRWWLLVHTILCFAKLPVTVVFYARLHGQAHMDQHVQEHVSHMKRTPAWEASKTVSLAIYVWFFIGLLWLIRTDHASCPGLYRLSLAVVSVATWKMMIMLRMVAKFPKLKPPQQEYVLEKRRKEAIAKAAKLIRMLGISEQKTIATLNRILGISEPLLHA
eukprot:gnl/MRDRNA2_/MRDRNA2_114166_c0_seq1.p1 gnl/MRDRNA2_/MRDRNA2_114166_c0~~gnl/MRDRNA2_/MRDRNA2_114166_c0_seq1.p1  ORF type:complete len:262 (-),score=33.20 gnl/MRDRNA2_/MRDRNA2_114166_c0_seq1:215-1000(-)